MKNVISWIKNNMLFIFMCIVLFTSVIMLALYFFFFHNNFSDNDISWANFGSYFASITGLLAFTGVLYTAWQSDRKANKMELQVKTKDERDLFFKMLELYQKQINLVTSNPMASKETVSGNNAFKILIDEINSNIYIYAILEDITTNASETFNDDIEQDIYSKLKIKYKIVPPKDKATILKIEIEKKQNYSNFEIPIIDSSYKDLSNRIITKKIFSQNYAYIYKTMQYACDCVYKKYSFCLGQYFRSIYYLMEMIADSEESDTYFKIFRAQLSTRELCLLLYNAVSNQSSRKVVEYLVNHDIFNNIDSDEILIYKKMGNDVRVETFIKNILDEYLKEHKS